jgi:hypothetical protein
MKLTIKETRNHFQEFKEKKDYYILMVNLVLEGPRHLDHDDVFNRTNRLISDEALTCSSLHHITLHQPF